MLFSAIRLQNCLEKEGTPPLRLAEILLFTPAGKYLLLAGFQYRFEELQRRRFIGRKADGTRAQRVSFEQSFRHFLESRTAPNKYRRMVLKGLEAAQRMPMKLKKRR